MLQRLTVMGCLLLLSACSIFKTERTPGEGSQKLWQLHQSQVAQLDAWDIQGKLAVRSPEQSGSGTLTWMQQHEYFDIHLSGPLGQGSVRLEGTPDWLQITTNKEQLSADSAEQLMQQQLGWSIPVEQLFWWVRGLPAPQNPVTLKLNGESLAQQLTQSGWQLEYLSYQPTSMGYKLPQRIRVSSPQLQLTLFIRSWNIRKQGQP